MAKISQHWDRNDAPVFPRQTRPSRRMEIERAVGRGLVVVGDELQDDPAQVRFVRWDDVIEALARQRAAQRLATALACGVRTGVRIVSMPSRCARAMNSRPHARSRSRMR